MKATLLNQYKLKKFSKKIDYSTYLEKCKDVCSGEFVFKNTRITPKNIWNYIAIKDNDYNGNLDILMQDVIENYPALNEEKVMIAILYCIKKYKQTLFEICTSLL